MTTETWRVVVEGGEVREMTPEACPQADGTMRWTVGGAGSHATQRGAVLMACVRNYAVAEILAPGEFTRAEALAAMRGRSAEIVEREEFWHRASEIGRSIRALPLEVPPASTKCPRCHGKGVTGWLESMPPIPCFCDCPAGAAARVNLPEYGQ